MNKKIILITAVTLITALTISACSARKDSINESTEPIYTEALTETAAEATATTAAEETTVNSEEETEHNITENITDFYHSLEDVDTDREKKQVRGDELKNIDFTDCQVAAIDSYGVKIYEYLSGDNLNDFLDCITQADISADKYGELPLHTGGIHQFIITLNTGEVIFIGEIEHKATNLHIIIINGEGYSCGEESSTKLSDLYMKAMERYRENALKGSISHAIEPISTEALTETAAEATAPPSAEETTVNTEGAAQSRYEKQAEAFRALEDFELDYEKMKSVSSEELKILDYSDCTVAALSGANGKIYEYLSEESIRDFIDCIVKAETSTEEYEVPETNGGAPFDFLITLNTGEQIFIGTSVNSLFVINVKHGYLCDAESLDKIREYRRNAYENFLEAVCS